MRQFLRYLYRWLLAFGIDPRITWHAMTGLPTYLLDLQKFNSQKKLTSTKMQFGALYPCLEDRYSQNGYTRHHYFHQDLLVAQRIFFNNPKHHVDIGSRVDGFVAHVASFRSIEVYDIRPQSSKIHHITFKQTDLMAALDENLIDYCDSLSCLHALEHFGLGRYGDPLNFDGYLLGLDNFYQILRKGGKFYFSVPIGPQRIEFNAHRVFSLEFLLKNFSTKYQIDQFSYVDDQAVLHENTSLTDDQVLNDFGCRFGCGIFEMTKT